MANPLPIDAAIVALVVVLTQVIKPFLELLVAPQNPQHDAAIRLLAVTLGVGAMLVERGVPVDGAGVLAVLEYGLGTGLAAVGSFHVLQSDGSQPPAGGPAAAPPARPVLAARPAVPPSPAGPLAGL